MMKLEELFVVLDSDTSGIEKMSRAVGDEMDEVQRKLGTVSTALTGATTAAIGLATAAAGVSTAVAGIGAAAAGGFATLGTIAAAQSEEIQNAFKGVGQKIATEAAAIAGPIEDALGHVARVISGTTDALKGGFAEGFATAAPYIERAANAASRFAQTVMPAMVSITKAAAPVVNALGRGFENLGSGLAGFLSNMESGMGGAAATIEALFGSLSKLLPVLGDVMGSIARATKTIGPAFADLFTELLTVTLRFLEGVIVPLSDEISAVVRGFTSFMRAIRETVGPVASFTAAVAPILGLLASFATTVTPVAAAIVALAGAAVTLHNNWSRVTGYLQSEFPQAFAVAKKAVGGFVQAAREIFGVLGTVVPKILRETGELVQSILEEWKAEWESFGDEAMKIMKVAFEGISWYMKTALQNLGDAVSLFLNVLTGDWGEAWNNVANIMRRTFGPAMNAVIGAMSKGLRKMADFLSRMSAIAGVVGDVVPGISALGTALEGAAATADIGAALLDMNKVDFKQKGEEVGSSFTSGFEDAMTQIGTMLGGGLGVPKAGFPDVGFQAPTLENLPTLEGLGMESIGSKMKESVSGLQPALDAVAAGWKNLAKTLGVTVPQVKKLGVEGAQALKKKQERVAQLFSSMQRTIGRAVSQFATTLFKGLGQLAAGTASMGDIADSLLQVFASTMQKLGSLLVSFGTAGLLFQGSGGFMSFLANPGAALAVGGLLLAASSAVKGLLGGAGSGSGGAPAPRSFGNLSDLGGGGRSSLSGPRSDGGRGRRAAGTRRVKHTVETRQQGSQLIGTTETTEHINERMGA